MTKNLRYIAKEVEMAQKRINQGRKIEYYTQRIIDLTEGLPFEEMIAIDDYIQNRGRLTKKDDEQVADAQRAS